MGNKNLYPVNPGKAGLKLFNIINFIAVLLFFIPTAGLLAQQAIPASGGDATGSGGSVSYTFGQLFYNMHPGTDGSVAESVQQPYEISLVTGITETEGITLAVSAFPNPAADYLILRVDDYDFENLDFLLLDVNGRLLREGTVTGSETTIPVANLAPAVYFLKVLQTWPYYTEIKTFKIIKN
jgi:hypothetical protein